MHGVTRAQLRAPHEMGRKVIYIRIKLLHETSIKGAAMRARDKNKHDQHVQNLAMHGRENDTFFDSHKASDKNHKTTMSRSAWDGNFHFPKGVITRLRKRFARKRKRVAVVCGVECSPGTVRALSGMTHFLGFAIVLSEDSRPPGEGIREWH